MIQIYFIMSQSHGTENGKENECLLQLWINYRIQLSVSIFPLFSKNQWLLTSHGIIILESIGTLKHFLLFLCIYACSACVCLLMFAVYGNTCTCAHTEAKINVICLPSSLSTMHIETGPLTWSFYLDFCWTLLFLPPEWQNYSGTLTPNWHLCRCHVSKLWFLHICPLNWSPRQKFLSIPPHRLFSHTSLSWSERAECCQS